MLHLRVFVPSSASCRLRASAIHGCMLPSITLLRVRKISPFTSRATHPTPKNPKFCLHVASTFILPNLPVAYSILDLPAANVIDFFMFLLCSFPVVQHVKYHCFHIKYKMSYSFSYPLIPPIP